MKQITIALLIALLAVVTISAPVAAQPNSIVAPVNCVTRYTVQRGDTLTKIAKRYNTTVSALASLNRITNIHRIFPGASLCVQSSSTAAAPTPASTSTPFAVSGGLKIVNTSAFKVLVAVWGPIQKRTEALPGKTLSLELSDGIYGWQVFGNGCRLLPRHNFNSRQQNTLVISSSSDSCGYQATMTQ